ncbi:MAG: FHA domain-containing protein [Archangium sp.]
MSRQLAFDASGFDKRYPCSWLVWELSGWTPPEASADQSVVDTRHDAESRPVNGDPLCFPLRRGDRLQIGRAAENEIVVSDATVSRTHAVLEKKGELWHLSVAADGASTRVGDIVVQPGSVILLGSGDGLELGGARLTFLDSSAFRVRGATAMLRAAGR